MINYAAKLRLFYTLNNFCVEKMIINEFFCCFWGENDVEGVGRIGIAASYVVFAVSSCVVTVSSPLEGGRISGVKGTFLGLAAFSGPAGASACIWGRCCVASMVVHPAMGAFFVADTVSNAPGGFSFA